MALVLNTTSYADIGGSITYFLDTLRNAEWSALSTTTKSAALIEATRYLDRLLWAGAKTSSSQALEWPRSGITDVSSSVVPTEIVQATYELAIRLAADPTAIDNIADSTGSNIKRVKAGDAEVEFIAAVTGTELPAWIHALVSKYLTSSQSSIAEGSGGGFAGDTTTESFFTSSSKYGRTEGFS